MIDRIILESLRGEKDITYQQVLRLNDHLNEFMLFILIANMPLLHSPSQLISVYIWPIYQLLKRCSIAEIV